MSKFKRILLKLSGEALAGEKGHGIDNVILSDMASEIASIVKQGVQVALVIGGGNLVRGISASAGGMNRAQGDAMGMLGTVMNGLAMQDALDKQGVDSVVMSAIRMEPVCEFFDRRKALKLLSAGSVVIFSAGTGNPFFTTDSCAALRAIESECDVIMKATKVDGIYTADPVKDPTATRFDDISYKEVIWSTANSHPSSSPRMRGSCVSLLIFIPITLTTDKYYGRIYRKNGQGHRGHRT